LTYHEPTLDATEIEQRLCAYLDELVRLAGGPLTVWRVARVAMERLRHAAAAPLDEPVTLPTLKPEAVLEAVAEAHGLTVDDLRGPDRARRISAARHHAAWELRQRRPDLPLVKIGAQLNRVDHATIINSLRRFQGFIMTGQYATERAHVECALSC
jgi:chromosomal replication initiation ATPase DnaA